MRGYRLPRPYRADLRSREIANRKYKVHLRRAGFRKFIPTLAPQTLDRQTRRLKLLQSVRIHSPGGMAARTETAKVGLSAPIQDRFPKNRTRGIPGAQKQHIVTVWHGDEIQLQQSVPQQGMPIGLVARTNALMNLSLICGPTDSASNPAACRNSRASSTW